LNDSLDSWGLLRSDSSRFKARMIAWIPGASFAVIPGRFKA
jgi:hypothetical protein